MFLRSKPELESFKRKRRREKKYLGEGRSSVQAHRKLVCSRECWPANLSLVPWLLEQRGASPPTQSLTQILRFPGNVPQLLNSLVLPLPPLWQIELMVGTTLAPFIQGLWKQESKNKLRDQKRALPGVGREVHFTSWSLLRGVGPGSKG